MRSLGQGYRTGTSCPKVGNQVGMHRHGGQGGRGTGEAIVMQKKSKYNVAVVGATGAVGRTMLSILEERKFPVDRLVPLASARSAGKPGGLQRGKNHRRGTESGFL